MLAAIGVAEANADLTSTTSARVLSVRHWTETQFSFMTTRPDGLRFENGQFVMLGIVINERPVLRAYSIASANYEDHLHFLSIKVPGGPLTSRLQHVRRGDSILISRKSTGTLLVSDLRPGKRLYLLATGTGVAPFLGILKEPEVYERFERVILVHGVRWVRETAVAKSGVEELQRHEVLGDMVRGKLDYYPTVTREPHVNCGRVTTCIVAKKIFRDLDLPDLNPEGDRLMVCGGPAMLADTSRLVDSLGFKVSPHIGEPGDYVIERAFVDR
jgi:ferredoxin/flavodoxin---NADP+ reductase